MLIAPLSTPFYHSFRHLTILSTIHLGISSSLNINHKIIKPETSWYDLYHYFMLLTQSSILSPALVARFYLIFDIKSRTIWREIHAYSSLDDSHDFGQLVNICYRDPLLNYLGTWPFDYSNPWIIPFGQLKVDSLSPLLDPTAQFLLFFDCSWLFNLVARRLRQKINILTKCRCKETCKFLWRKWCVSVHRWKGSRNGRPCSESQGLCWVEGWLLQKLALKHGQLC